MESVKDTPVSEHSSGGFDKPTTTHALLAYIEKCICMDMLIKQSPEQSLFNLWKILCSFYRCDITVTDNFVIEYRVVEQIYTHIEESYSNNMDPSEALANIKAELLNYNRMIFAKSHKIDVNCTKCKIGIIATRCVNCHTSLH